MTQIIKDTEKKTEEINRFRIEPSIKTEFTEKCKLIGKKPPEVLRLLMLGFIRGEITIEK